MKAEFFVSYYISAIENGALAGYPTHYQALGL
jgi:hypothetical protein